MKKSLILNLTAFLCGLFLFSATFVFAQASDESRTTTITIEAYDNNKKLEYALDDGGFYPTNTFEVEEGSTHTIRVRDEAGNITSQSYTASSSNKPYDYEVSASADSVTVSDGQSTADVNVDVDLTARSKYAGSGADSYYSNGKEPAEGGGGTLYDKVETTGSSDDAKVFYTVTTDDGEVFYMVVDQTQSENNVYLLDQVTLTDLNSIAQNNLDKAETKGSASLLDNLSSKDAQINDIMDEKSSQDDSSKEGKKQNNGSTTRIIFTILIFAGMGAYYYFKKYRNKRDERMDAMDALDRDDFEVDDNRFSYDEDEDGEEMTFESTKEDEESEGVGDEEWFSDPEEAEFEDDEIIKEDVALNNDEKPDADDEVYGFGYSNDNSLDSEEESSAPYEENEDDYDEDEDEEDDL